MSKKKGRIKSKIHIPVSNERGKHTILQKLCGRYRYAKKINSYIMQLVLLI